MYSDVGKKIMGLAKICSWICLICGALIWIINITDYSYYNDDVGWICLAVGVLTYFSSWTVYGFGQLVDDVHAMRNQTTAPATQNDELPEL